MTAETEKARTLRRRETEAEKSFWRKVRNRQQGHKFYRQVPVKGYIADFLCPELKLIVEIDGGQHNENAADGLRTKALGTAGYKVVRFWNNEVLGNIDGVLVALRESLEKRQKERELPWT